MHQSSTYFAGAFTVQNFPNAGYSTDSSNDPNLQFFRQTFQEPLQYGMASCGRPVTTSVKSFSTASTERWPSDEQYVPFPNEPPMNTDTAAIAAILPIREIQHLIDLENRIASVQQYECLLSHLQILLTRYRGSFSEMLRNFITDSVLRRISFNRTNNETYVCAMKPDLQRVMLALKASWFPDKNQECFEVQMAQLLKNSHDRCKARANAETQASTKGLDLPIVKCIKPEYQQTDTYLQNSAVSPQKMYMFQQNQWYQYALYYRNRYQIARKTNQKLKNEFAEQQMENRKRISGCLKRVRAMQQYLDVLEERVQHLE